MYVKVKDLNTSIGYMLLEKGIVDEVVEIKPVDVDWKQIKDELMRLSMFTEDKVDDVIKKMKEESIPSYIIGKNGQEIHNTFGLGQLFYPMKTDIKENKDEIGK